MEAQAKWKEENEKLEESKKRNEELMKRKNKLSVKPKESQPNGRQKSNEETEIIKNLPRLIIQFQEVMGKKDPENWKKHPKELIEKFEEITEMVKRDMRKGRKKRNSMRKKLRS